MRVAYSVCLILVAVGLLPAAANAGAVWNCGAGTGWLAAGGQRIDAPRIGAQPCPSTQSSAAGVDGSPGSLAAAGSVVVDGGSDSQTTDARQPRAKVQAKSLAIHNADGKLVLTAAGLESDALGSCD